MKKAAFLFFTILISTQVFAQTQNAATGPPPPPSIHPNTVESSPILIAKKDAPGKEQSISIEKNNIADNIAKEKNYSWFYKAVQKAGLAETFRSAGPITLFIPDNAAFEKMPKGKLDTLMRDDHQLELVAFVTYYAIEGKVNAHNIAKQISKQKNLAAFKTISGARLQAKMSADHNIILVDEYGRESTINKTNIKQSNGMLFVISDVLYPKNHMI